MSFRQLVTFVLLVIMVSASQGFAADSSFRVKWGETLFSILSDKFTPQDILDIDRQIKAYIPNFRLKKGTKVQVAGSSYIFHLSREKEIHINKSDENVVVDYKFYPIETVNDVIEGYVESSLIEAVQAAGEDFVLAYRLADIYEWEIDFFKDLRKGDSFRILVEKRFVRGEFLGYGNILAADFINQGNLIRALYYESPLTKGYFRPDGRSLKKGFLKAPLRFRRISSKFNPSRLHPIFKRYMPHNGVDYAAPTGTPVFATADGVVIKRSYKKGNGRYVVLSHKNSYKTYYLHLNGFKRGLKVGSKVRQGDLIAYVGSTGYSTGPHLDYRIKKGRHFINPLRFKAPSKKLPEKTMADFSNYTARFASKLDDTYLRSSKYVLLR